MRTLTVFLCLVLTSYTLSYAQDTIILQEDFNQHLQNSPYQWQQFITSSGSLPTGSFTVREGVLESDFSGGSGTRQTVISTSINNWKWSKKASVSWSFNIQHDFTVTSSLHSKNLSHIYLISDHPNLNETQNGYFLKLNNKLRFYRKTDGENHLLLEISETFTQPDIHIVVKRELSGLWHIFINDTEKGTVNDITLTEGNHFGIQTLFSASSRGKSFFYDNFKIKTTEAEADTKAPSLTDIKALNSQKIQFNFNEAIQGLEQITFNNEVQTNFLIIHNKVEITIPYSLVEAENYNIKLSNITDKSNNYINIDTIYTFPDIISPSIKYFELIPPRTIKLDFSEDVLFLPENIIFQGNILGNSQSKKGDLTEWYLFVEENFSENRSLELTLQGVKDKAENLLDTTLIFTIDTRKPKVTALKTISPQQLEITFSEAIDSLTTKAINHYILNDSIYPQSIQLIDSDKVILAFTKSFQQETNYKIKITNISDTSNNTITNKNYYFLYDTNPPTLDSLKVLYNQELKLYFSENLEDIDISSFNLKDIGLPTNIKQWIGDKKQVSLYFTNIPQTHHELIVENIKDLNGNLLSKENFTFSNQKSALSKIDILTPTQILLHFSHTDIHLKKTDIRLSTNIQSNQITAQNNASIFQVELDKPLEENIPYTLFLENATVQDTSINIIYKNRIKDIEVTSSQSINITLDGVAEAFKKTDFSIENLSIIEVQRDNDNPEKIHIVTQPITANQWYTLTIKNHLLNNDEIFTEATKPFQWDTAPPSIEEIQVTNHREVQIIFNEPIHNITAKVLNHYILDSFVYPEEIFFDVNQPNTAILRFPFSLEPEKIYPLTIKNIKDLSNNILPETTQSIKRALPPQKDELIFTEFRPTGENEFIEIYNFSDRLLNIGEVKFSDQLRTIPLPFYELKPKEYLVLYPPSSVNKFQYLDNAVRLDEWTNLNSKGDSLILTNNENIIIDKVGYDQNWNKEGFENHSFELIDFSWRCLEEKGWSYSQSKSKNTAGVDNSEYYNENKVEMLITIHNNVDNSILQLEFSDVINMEYVNSVDNFSILPTIPISNIEIVDNFHINLHLGKKLSTKQVYYIRISGLKDCANRDLSTKSYQHTVDNFASEGQLLISEIMYDPFPSNKLPEKEYLEIINISENIISLKNVNMLISHKSTILPDSFLLPYQQAILCNEEDMELFKPYGKTIGLSTWHTLNNESGNIILISQTGEVISQVAYESKWHLPENREGGVSLELIDTNSRCMGKQNWKSAIDESGGTPAKENSVKGIFQDSQAPHLTEVYAEGEYSIKLEFNEPLDTLSLQKENFNINTEIAISDIFILDLQTLLLETVLPLTINQTHLLNWQNVMDCSGNYVSGFQQYNFIVPAESEGNEILLSEILFNPPSNGVDFVELYNSSNQYIDLSGWSIGNNKSEPIFISEKPVILSPYTFAVLTSSKEQLKEQYSITDSLCIEIKLPSFNDDEGSVQIFDEEGNLTGQFDYHKDMHFQLLNNIEGVSLERLDYTISENNPENWHSASENVGFGTPTKTNSQQRPQGYTSSSCFAVEPQTFFISGTAEHTYTLLSYHCETFGKIANVSIINKNGHQVKKWVSNSILSNEAFYKWDGLNDNGEAVPTGIYLLWIQTFDMNGNKEEFLKEVVVGKR